MSARFLAFLGALALVRAQEVSLPVISPTDTAIVSLPTEGTTSSPDELPPSATATQPSFSDTVITSGQPGTLTLSTDLSITDPIPTASSEWSASLPWIPGPTTITTTNQDGQTTTDTIGGGGGGGSSTATTGSEGAGEPSTITTVTSTSTGGSGDGGGSSSSTDEPTETSSDGSPTETPAAAPRVEAMGVGFVAFVAGLLAL